MKASLLVKYLGLLSTLLPFEFCMDVLATVAIFKMS